MTTPAIPQWIEPMYAPMTGQNHLGLTSVSSSQILPTLSPGIIVQTVHPRYHSFYAFVLEEFWQRRLPRTLPALVDFFRPCEFIFSVGCLLCDSSTHEGTAGIIGAAKTSALARQRLPEYDPSFDYIDTPLGGLQLYYRGVMAGLELITPGGHGIPVPLRSGQGSAAFPIDIPTGRGPALARAFREAVKDTAYYSTYMGTRDPVPLEVVEEFGRVACLCRLQDPSAPDHQPLLDLFMHAGEDAQQRRATFRLFLDLAEQTDEYAVDQEGFRRLIYFGRSGAAEYAPREEVRDALAHWRLYQAREYYAFALNTMWAYFCDWGVRAGGDVHALSVEDYLEHCRGNLRLRETAAMLDAAGPELTPASPWRELEDWLLELVGAESAGDFDRLARLDSELQEDALYRLAKAHVGLPAASLTGMVVMLAVLALRFADLRLRTRPEWEIARMGGQERPSFDTFLRDLDGLKHNAGLTIEEVLRRISERYVVAQHLRWHAASCLTTPSVSSARTAACASTRSATPWSSPTRASTPSAPTSMSSASAHASQARSTGSQRRG